MRNRKSVPNLRGKPMQRWLHSRPEIWFAVRTHNVISRLKAMKTILMIFFREKSCPPATTQAREATQVEPEPCSR